MADHVVRDAKKLKWIQALGTGVDNIVDLPSLGKEVLVTNIRGIHGAPVSEATHRLHAVAGARPAARRARAGRAAMGALAGGSCWHGKTVGILGVGADRRISGADLQDAST